MSAGQVWQRADGLTWVEVQAAALEPSGWRLMVPLTDDAMVAPPLVVEVGAWHARVHLAVGVPSDDLGQPQSVLTGGELELLRDALAALVGRG